MTLKEFKKLLDEDKELQKKFKKAKESVKADKDKAVAMSKICADLGFDVPASEFALEVIGCQELDDEELEAVAGGRGTHTSCVGNDKCSSSGEGYGPVANWGEEGCVYDYVDTDCNFWDYCDAINVWYPAREECRFDYRDTNCSAWDYCDLMVVTSYHS